MKILHVIPYFTPKRGGDVNVCNNLAKELSRSGHEVTIITSDFELDELYTKSVEKEGVKVHSFHCYSSLFLFLYTPSMDNWLEKNIKTFDIVHIHDFRSYQSIIAYKYANKFKIPFIIQPHGSTLRRVSKQKLKWLFDTFFGNKIMKSANAVIAVSKEEGLHDFEMGAKNVEVIYNGLETDLYENLPEYGKFKDKIAIENKIILYLGRINKSKGLATLIRSFSLFKEEFPDKVTLIISGFDDSYQDILEELVNDLNLKEDVIFTGFVSDEDKISAYRDSDLFVHSVRYMGGVGLAPIEAVLAGTPIVVSEGCGELILDINCGYLVEFGDEIALKNMMIYVLKNLSEAKEKTDICKEYIINNFKWETVAKNVESVYLNSLHNY
jgi:glycosyltransferase involved in cell wall biosynthesis